MTTRLDSIAFTRSFRFIVTTALAAGMLTGCTAGGPHPAKFAAGAQSAMDRGHSDKAVPLAEQAVQADPRNASYRMLLGNAYLRAGRFESARQAYDEAMELGEDGGKAALSLALADIALGKYSQAVDTLNTYRDAIPAPDFGLAMAMAGQTARGVTVLADALRNGENTPKVRQNLAFAYAMDGSWREARVMASQDVPADQLGERLQQWAAMGRPEDMRLRVASLLGVPLRGDAGQPAALALANFPAPQQLADDAARKVEAGAAPAPAFAKAAIEELPPAPQPAAPAPVLADASSAPQQAQLAAIDVPASQSATAPQAAPYRVVGSYTPAPQRSAARAAAAPVAVAAKPVAQAASADNGTHVVQLGAFSTPEGAHRAWRHFVARDPKLNGYRSLITQATVHGRQFWRVQAAGFAGFAPASTLCGSVKARGGVCLVMAAPRTVSPQGHPAETRMARNR